MSIINFLSQPMWQRLGLVLGHFLWQGCVVAALVIVLLRVFSLARGISRYTAYLLAFVTTMACPILTFIVLDGPAESSLIRQAMERQPETVQSESLAPSLLSLPSAPGVPSASAESESEAWANPSTQHRIPKQNRIEEYWDTLLPWALLVWLFGVLVLSGRLLLGCLGVYRWQRQLQPLPEDLLKRVARLSDSLGLGDFRRVFASPGVSEAMAMGYLRPMVLLPAAMLTRMQPDMLEAIIAHELAHIRRFDLWVNLIQRVVETLLFYHPAVWWLSKLLRCEREFCCDELAVRATGQRLAVAAALENAGRLRLPGQEPTVAIGFRSDHQHTLSRVRHILGLDSAQPNSRFWLAGMLTTLLLAAVTALTIGTLEAEAKQAVDERVEAKPVSRRSPAEKGGQRKNKDTLKATDKMPGVQHYVQASPLNSLERELIKQLVDLAQQIERKYPDPVTDWPAGAGFYHVDQGGEVTVWNYRCLRRRNTKCLEDEVDWGSSRLVDAKGSFYLTDGTALQSRWSGRAGGMKDIWVKIGRKVRAGERVPLVHRHRLWSSYELLSRDGLEKKIQLLYWEDRPFGFIVRVDRPLRLSGWWLGDGIKQKKQQLETSDQMTIHVPPENHGGPMLVTVAMPEGQISNKTAISVERKTEDRKWTPPQSGTGRVEGRLNLGVDAVEGSVSLLKLPLMEYGAPVERHGYDTSTGSDGRFAFEDVPSGWYELGYMVQTSGFSAARDVYAFNGYIQSPGFTYTIRKPILVKANGAVRVNLGFEGRDVVGRFVLPEDSAYPAVPFGILEGIEAFYTKYPDIEERRPADYDQMSRQERQAWTVRWYKSQDYIDQRRVQLIDPQRRHYVAIVRNDGSFQIKHVIPGQYEFYFVKESMKHHEQFGPLEVVSFQGRFVTPAAGGASPFDLGRLVVNTHTYLQPKQPAPDFSVRTIKGQQLQLAQLKGKTVLLYFQSGESNNAGVNDVRQAWEPYATDKRLVVIGMYVDVPTEELQRVVQGIPVPWHMVHLNSREGEEVMQAYSGAYHGCYFLINGQGEVVAGYHCGAERLKEALVKTLEVSL